MDEKDRVVELEQGAAGEAAAAAAEQGAELEKLVDRLVEKRMARLQAEADGRVAQARSEGRAEAERLAGMSADERRRYEDEAAKAREAELNRREEELDRRELRAWAAEELAARELPGELAEFVDCSDAGRCSACVDALEKAFREAVRRAVDARLNRGHALPAPCGGANLGMTQRMRTAAGLDAN